MDKTHFVVTADGSRTLYQPEVGEHYHSKHGAYQESKHVFLGQGLQHYLADNPTDTEVNILEVGFGTGLNFLLTADYVSTQQQDLYYCGVEAYPLSQEVISQMGYDGYVEPALWENFLTNYESGIGNKSQVNAQVTLEIAHQKILSFTPEKRFHVVYFDAFAAIHQPEMWTDEVLSHVANFLVPGGIFVTYAITGNLKRSMKALGFSIEKAPGAPGKREMLRATKQ
ncbi:tRNA (5-methylaminomethyl-2-thiouridine)(34)-methyltransferase MnmD [Sphingobacterium sp. lm-10]|uniref:tRNA (5-methylaminomethyl-2-thiouridine)(34)-methyltransferase MnmD n=1 Tax=Sphingobacterium sp. lm-10 TaxID=2944904 RepID=UPI0020210CA9|nr:tRNA (5-methylaminomethyl-2-thiouridine)(34)-methyltransferase MnmD [Sphingobacterium sp. lm-10]MCL7988899.1 tRNA (5-methylaminomethyl-2-thiouridine)(34)-methyltransferase MnmD [Sphingobacterium sp. lm-10]